MDNKNEVKQDNTFTIVKDNGEEVKCIHTEKGETYNLLDYTTMF